MPAARPSRLAFIAALCAAGAFGTTFADATWSRHRRHAASEQRLALVTQLQLTDRSLFTEARYTRHLSQADLHSA